MVFHQYKSGISEDFLYQSLLNDKDFRVNVVFVKVMLVDDEKSSSLLKVVK